MRIRIRTLRLVAIISLSVVIGVDIQPAESQTLYAIHGKRGVVTFTSRKPAAGVKYRTIVAKRPRSSIFIRAQGSIGRPVKSAYDGMIKQVAMAHDLDPALVKAVVHAESSFNPFATSHKGAMGLMQLMPATAERFGVKNAYHPEENLKGGAKYLKMLLERYSGDLRLALAAYNAGENVVDRLRAVPPYSETQGYVRRVQGFLKVYRCAETTGNDNCRA